MPLPLDIPVEQLPIPALATWSARWRSLINLLESEAPCIYLPNYDFWHSCVTSALSHRVGVVGIVHSDDAQHYDHARRMGKTWNAAVAVSEAVADRVRHMRIVESSRLSVIPYGVDSAQTQVARPDREEIRLIYTGRLDANQKRVADLLGIAAALAHRGVQFTLTIVGAGPERAKLEQEIAARGLSPRVRMLQPMDNRRVLEMCAESDVVVLTSAYEGMPISILEAMGQGCVPVMSDIASGVPELIRDGVNGFVVPVGSIEQYASLIEQLAASRETRQRMSLEAWRTVSDGPYRIEVMTGRYIELFERVEREMSARTFARPGGGAIARAPLTLSDRLAAPLWSFHPAIRRQQNLAG